MNLLKSFAREKVRIYESEVDEMLSGGVYIKLVDISLWQLFFVSLLSVHIAMSLYGMYFSYHCCDCLLP